MKTLNLAFLILIIALCACEEETDNNGTTDASRSDVTSESDVGLTKDLSTNRDVSAEDVPTTKADASNDVVEDVGEDQAVYDGPPLAFPSAKGGGAYATGSPSPVEVDCLFSRVRTI